MPANSLVIHDATLERTTDGEGPVRALTPEGRAGRQAQGQRRDHPDPFRRACCAGDGRRLPLHVEIKSDETGTPYPGIVDKVAAELARHGLAERSHLTSFDLSVLEECRRQAPDIARLVSVNAAWAERHGGLKTFIEKVEGLVEIVAIHHELLEAEWELVTALLPLDRLCVWTLNDEALIGKWLGARHRPPDLGQSRPRPRPAGASMAAAA